MLSDQEVPVDRKPVSSSNISSIGYDSNSQTLEIEFNTGGIYQYYGVNQDLFNGLMSASSHGSFFHENIRGKYGDTKVG